MMRRVTLGLAAGLLSLAGCVGQGLAPRQTFPVFFKSDRTTLDAPAHAVVARAAQWARRYPSESVAVTGYAVSAAATALAYQRARAIAEDLARDGVATARVITGVSTDKSVLASGLADRRVDITVGK